MKNSSTNVAKAGRAVGHFSIALRRRGMVMP